MGAGDSESGAEASSAAYWADEVAEVSVGCYAGVACYDPDNTV